MKKSKSMIAFIFAISLLASCKKKDAFVPQELEPSQIPNNITANTTLTNDRIWILKGETHIVAPNVLTIQEGTVIRSDVSEKGALVVDKGAKIQAIGTVDKPIIFTSGVTAGSRAPGDWAGITIIGRAPTNRKSEGQVEGGVAGTFGLDNVPNDNSGTLKYVRIEYAGIAVAQGSEVNALSLYAVGAGTTLDHIQVSYAKDDAFEFFGGTVNGKYLVSYGTSDDDFDFDYGYTGKLQFGLALRRPELVDASDQGNGIECDNENPIPAAGPSEPFTKPYISNFTLLGSNGASTEAEKHFYANRWRRGARFVFVNSILAGFKEGGFSMESSETVSAYLSGNSIFKNNIVTAMKQPYINNALDLLSVDAMKIKAEADGCITLANSAAVGLNNAFNLNAPNFLPIAGSVALSGTFVAPIAGDSFFTSTSYRGAFGSSDNWITGWTNFSPNLTVY